MFTCADKASSEIAGMPYSSLALLTSVNQNNKSNLIDRDIVVANLNTLDFLNKPLEMPPKKDAKGGGAKGKDAKGGKSSGDAGDKGNEESNPTCCFQLSILVISFINA